MMRNWMIGLGLSLAMVACGDKAENDEDDGDVGGGAADWMDEDGDGHAAVTDCDDTDPEVNSSAEEVPYDGIDNDCDEDTPDDDLDSDGYASDEDCDDADPLIHPGRSEVCDGVDNDCSGVVDDNAGAEWYRDGDSDGYGDATDAMMHCDGESGYVANDDDCDDSAAAAHPGADELCNAADDDCDGDIDEDAVDGLWFFMDLDSDGYGDPAMGVQSCTEPADHADNDDDCDDGDPAIHPDADEICDAVDNDCDGYTDEDDATGGASWYVDADGDGYGDPDATVAACTQPSGTSAEGTDCDDTDAGVHPGATETWYDGFDTDCAGDDYDADGDGDRSEAWGGGDCDEADATIHTAATEAWYDGVDQDCDGLSDYDADGDTYDSDAYAGADCDDTSSTVYPGAPEIDGTLDNDCDGEIEEMPTAVADYDTSGSLEHCSPLQLDGSGSYDPDGTAVTYEWELTSAPSGSARVSPDIAETTDESPVFYPDIAGDYTFTLTVEDEGDATSTPSSTSVTITSRATNNAPVAAAGDDQTVTATAECIPISYGVSYDCPECETSITLDASGTTDADDEPLTYAWSILSGTATLSDEDTATPTIDLTSAASFGVATTSTVELQVEVTDCYGDTSTDTVTITFECTGESGGS